MLTLLAFATFCLPALALAVPSPIRARLGTATALLAGLYAWLAFSTSATPLEVVHTFPAFEGNLVRPKAFPIETVEGGTRWAWLGVAWCLVVGGVVARVAAPRPRPLGWPLALAVGGACLVLAWQKSGAPSALCQPLRGAALPPLEIALWPGAVAAAILIGRSARSIPDLVLRLPLWIAAARVPFVVFAVLATRGHWGTYFDVHSIEFVADPLRQRPLELAPGSTDQLTWIVFGPQLLVLPGLTWLSASGFAFMVYFARRQAEENLGRSAS